MKQHLNIKIYGLVQGVFFRATAEEEADKLKITGFAKNEDDGSVYIEAEGEKENLEKFVQWCNLGPNMAQVEKVTVEKINLKRYSNFTIK